MVDKMKPLTVREKFSHGRTRSATVEVKKPGPRPPVQPVPPSQEDREWMEEYLGNGNPYAAPGRSPVGAAPHYPSVGGTTVTISKDRTRASLLAGSRGQARIVVRGCGPVPAKTPKRKKVVVEMTALDGRVRLACRGITCDGEMVLPKRTVQVRLELVDLGSSVEVTVEGRPAGSRKKYGPKRWIVRRTERPVAGRYRRPKPRV